jgi:hypothetical protein
MTTLKSFSKSDLTTWAPIYPAPPVTSHVLKLSPKIKVWLGENN